MSILATDDFNRAPSGTLGPNWAPVGGDFGINPNGEAEILTGGAFERYSAITWPNDQYSKCTLRITSTVSDEGAGPAVRIDLGGATTMYLVVCNTVDVKLYSAVAGAYNPIGSAGPAASGDVIEIRAQGNQISVFKNGGAPIIGPITNSAIPSGGAGIYASHPSALVSVDDWEGGGFAGHRLLKLGVK